MSTCIGLTWKCIHAQLPFVADLLDRPLTVWPAAGVEVLMADLFHSSIAGKSSTPGGYPAAGHTNNDLPKGSALKGTCACMHYQVCRMLADTRTYTVPWAFEPQYLQKGLEWPRKTWSSVSLLGITHWHLRLGLWDWSHRKAAAVLSASTRDLHQYKGARINPETQQGALLV